MIEFRKQSRLSRMRRGVKCAAELLEERVKGDGYRNRALFVTLTYRDGVRWSPSHIRKCINAYRMWAKRKETPFRYVWVAELTQRGRMHYHLMIWIRAAVRMPAPDRAGFWPYGQSQTARARSPVGYLIKYASKGDAATAFPRGARLFGCGGLPLEDRKTKAWRVLPLYVRVAFNVGDGVRRVRGGGWLSSVTGEWMPSASLYFDEGRIKVRYPSDSH